VIRPEAYRLKGDDNALSKDLGTAMSFLLFLSFSLTLLSERSYKSTPTRTLFGLERSGALLGGSTTPLLLFLPQVLFYFCMEKFLPTLKRG